MNNKGNITHKATLILGVISCFWILFFVYEISFDLYDFIFGRKGLAGLIGYLFLLVFHVFSFLFLINQIWHVGSRRTLLVLALVLGIVSLFSIGIEKVLYDEIGHEYYAEGGRPGEVSLLYIPYSFNLVFILLSTFIAFRSGKARREEQIQSRDEVVFTVAQFMGIISGILGLFLTLSLQQLQISAGSVWKYLPFYALFVLPYAVTVVYWLLLKRRLKVSDWYDEKQWRDISRASLITLLISVPGMALLLLVQKSILFYWFPYYLFLTLLVFSCCTLYFFKMK